MRASCGTLSGNPTTFGMGVAPNCGNAPEWTTEKTSSYESSDDQARAPEIAPTNKITPGAATRRTTRAGGWPALFMPPSRSDVETPSAEQNQASTASPV